MLPSNIIEWDNLLVILSFSRQYLEESKIYGKWINELIYLYFNGAAGTSIALFLLIFDDQIFDDQCYII